MRLNKIKIIILVIISSISTACSSFYYDKESYLELNNTILNLDDTLDFSGFDIFKSNLDDKKIVLTGELHGISSNELINIKLVKYLKNKINFKYYLMESSYSTAYFINKYLNTGDEEILKSQFKKLDGTYAYSEDKYNFFKELYEFNKGLDEEEKIEVIGIDMEQNLPITYMYLKDTLGNKLNNDFNVYLNNSISTENYYDELKTKTETLLTNINDNELYYKTLLDSEFENVKHVLINLIAYCDSSITVDDEMQIREDQIYSNFKFFDKNSKDSKYFGQWGSFHIYNYDNNTEENKGQEPLKSFAMRLKDDKKYKDKVISIFYLYNNCTQMRPLGYNNGYTEIDLNYTSDEFEYYTDSKCYIFNFNQNKSPYPAKSYIDYIILFNNFDACTPLNFKSSRS